MYVFKIIVFVKDKNVIHISYLDMSKETWDKVLKQNGWNAVELRDNRYNQVIHLVTAANGAEPYYNLEDNPHRSEGIGLARKLDKATIEAWVGHPYIDVIDNSTDFDTKLRRMIAVKLLMSMTK